ncbi:MAG: hypothetical protein KatS3mg007_0646 [Thermoanaerobaculum sp.]|nr:MAG: hypothetical protein KatS3mg007_0646 [Thermoanaerobaculum sp.]
MPLQAPHLAHVLLPTQSVNDAAGAQEQAGFEEGVGEDVKDGRRKGSGPRRQEHVPQLADGGVGQDLFDVVLRQANGGGKDRRQAPHHRHHQHGFRGVPVDDVGAGHHVHPGGDHGGGVDEGGDRRGAGHGIGKPHVEGKLGGFAHSAHKEQQANGVEVACVACGVFLHRLGDLAKVHGAKDLVGQEDGQEKAKVPDAVDDEGFFACGSAPVLGEVVANEEVGAKANAFPAHKEDQEVGPQDEGEHGKHEEVEVSKVAGKAPVAFAVHVAHGVNVNQEPHKGDKEHHDRRKRIQTQGKVNGKWRQLAGHGMPGKRRDPRKQRHLPYVVATKMPKPVGHRGKGGQHGQPATGQRYRRSCPLRPSAAVADQAVGHRPQQRKQKHQA